MAATAATIPRTRRRLLRVALAIIIALTAMLAATWLLVVPAIVHARVDHALRLVEPGHRQFTIASIGLGQTVIERVELGARRWLTAERITVRYDVGRIMRGELAGVDIAGAHWQVRVVDGVADWGFAPGQHAAQPITLPADSIDVRDALVSVDIDGSTVRVPVTITAVNSGSARAIGRMQTGAINFQQREFAAVSGTFELAGGVMTASALWPVIAAAPMRIDCAINVAGERVSGNVDAHQPVFRLADARAFIEMIPAMRGVDVGGQAAIDARLAIGSSGAQPVMTVRFGDLMLAREDWPVAVVSASGTLQFDAVAPLRTAGLQRVDVHTATTGPVDIVGGVLEFEMLDARTVRIDDARWHMSDGGAYRVRPLTIDFAQPRIATRVSCENVGLDFWLRLLTDNRADGVGRLRGEFAVDWNPQARPRLQFPSGSFVATPPTGVIRVHDAPRLGEMIDLSDPRFHVDQALRVVRDRIVDALADFGFNRLRLDFVPDGRQTILRADMEGQGRRGERAQQFSGLVVNIGRFAETLQVALDSVAATHRLQELRHRPRPAAVPVPGAPVADLP